jgi:hypothetical protein
MEQIVRVLRLWRDIKAGFKFLARNSTESVEQFSENTTPISRATLRGTDRITSQ